MSSEIVKKSSQKTLHMGLGEAMIRLNQLQTTISSGISKKAHKEEYKLIMNALNNITIDVGFDCNDDGIPDTVDIFEATANTSCCRLIETESDRKKTTTSSRRKKKTSSRRK